MANKLFQLGTPSPAADNFEQGQLTLLDLSANISGFSGNDFFGASITFGDQFQSYPSLAASIVAGVAFQADRRTAPVLLGRINANLALATKQTVFTCPAGFICEITDVVFGRPSVSLATASISLGWNAGATDVVANATHTGLTGPTLYKKLTIIATGAVRGAAGDVFGILAGTPQDPATAWVDAIGYLIPV